MDKGSSAPDKPELLPCPFCGEQPRFTERGSVPSEGSPTGRIYFLACMCGGYSARAHQFGYSRDEVVAAWNRRAPHPDARRLDLIERERVSVQYSALCRAWTAWCHRFHGNPYGRGDAAPTIREAIDAAEKRLEGGQDAG